MSVKGRSKREIISSKVGYKFLTAAVRCQGRDLKKKKKKQKESQKEEEEEKRGEEEKREKKEEEKKKKEEEEKKKKRERTVTGLFLWLFFACLFASSNFAASTTFLICEEIPMLTLCRPVGV